MPEARELGQELLPADGRTIASLDGSDSQVGSSFASTDAVSGGQAPVPSDWSLSSLSFAWVFPLLRQRANSERLEPTDLFGLSPNAKPEALYDAFIHEWRRLVNTLPPGTGSSRTKGRMLLRVLGRVHLKSIGPLWLGRLCQVALSFSFPFFLNKITNFVSDDSATAGEGLLLAFGLLACQLGSVVLDNNTAMGMQSLGLRIRSSMITAIFRKLIVLRQDALLSFSSGKLNNLITTDVDKARRVVRYIHILLFTAPMTITVGMISLYKLVGVSMFIGFGWMGFVILLNPICMYYCSKLEDKQQSKTDERVRKATETISSIQVVKCYAWEEAATGKVEEARRVELLSMWRLYCLYTVFEGLWSSVVPVTTAVMFSSYAILNPDKPLTSAQAFTAMSLLSLVQTPLFTIPWVLNLIVEALVAAKRLERLFFLPEADLPSTNAIGSFSPIEPGNLVGDENQDMGPVDVAVRFQGHSFAWPITRSRGGEGEDPDAEDHEQEDDAPAASSSSAAQNSQFQLLDMELSVPHGALVAVVGATASGKTSLLQAVLGEMPPAGPDLASKDIPVRRTKPIAFAPQQPWIFNATVRENILFGEPYSEKRYKECLRCCELEKDLELLKDGDKTKVGEKGIALSGGQKSRVCLARAAYRQQISNIFLLDDPYSALDAHVAKKVHEEAVTKLLAKKTRIVVTNRLEFVSGCDFVAVLDGGKIEAVGKYEDVRNSSSSLRTLLAAQGLNGDSADGEVNGVAQPDLARAVSYNSAKSEEEDSNEHDDDEEGGGFGDEDEEHRATGQIKKEVIGYYLQKMGGAGTVSTLAFLYIFSELLNLSLPIWMAKWTTDSPEKDELPRYLTVYAVLSVASVIFMTVRDLCGNVLSFRAARRMHAAMFSAILRAPMSFFQDTPQGRIINRFSKDISEIDKELIWQMIYTVVPVLNVLGSFALVGGIAYFSLLAFLPAFWLYYRCWKFYNGTVMDIKRMSKTTSSPVYDHFNNLCRENAVSIVRAHGQAERQCRTNNRLIAEQQRPEYSMIYVESWFCMCVENLGCVLVFFVALFAVLGRGTLINASKAALCLTFAGECSGSIQSLIGQLAEFGMAFNCVERVKEYATELPAEAAYVIEDRRPPRDWPTAGVLEVHSLHMRYRPNLPLVLKDLNFTTAAGERIGVVGRTGAGKSSLLLALLRIAEPDEGSRIILDGEDLCKLGLKDVRSGIAMIPQEPVLFQETLLYNCDPYGYHTAAEVWAALEEAQLAPWVRERFGTSNSAPNASTETETTETPQVPLVSMTASAPPSTVEIEKMLKLEIKEGGQNLSAGQRQMVAIARAVLRKSKMVVLDEATAAVDAATDAAIQLAVRRCFRGATTLTIAHRLQTILDSDRVLVLSHGEMAEFAPPSELRAMNEGIFKGMVEEAGL